MIGVSTLAALGAPAAFAQTDLSWVGGDDTANWSAADNWSGGAAPTAADSPYGTLTFGDLGAACDDRTSSETCYQSKNDVSGLSANAISIDAEGAYVITGDGITLGSGGLSAAPTGDDDSLPELYLPITLGADQTWTIGGGVDEDGVLEVAETDGVGGISGDYALNLDLGTGGYFYLDAPLDVGNFTANSSGPTDAIDLCGYGLNGADGDGTVTLDGPTLSVSGHCNSTTSPIGQLTTEGGTSLAIGGSDRAPEPVLAVNGTATLGADSNTDLQIDSPGTTPVTDYAQLTATGDVSVAGALNLDQEEPATGDCEDLHPGDVDTLISTTGTLSGTFHDVPNDTVVTITDICDDATVAATAEINYKDSAPGSVTATIVNGGNAGGPPQNAVAPTISGTAQVGQTLSATTGSWINSPTSYTYAWSSCRTNAGCRPVGTDSPTYAVQQSDVGATMLVTISASNAAGSNDANAGDQAVVTAEPSPVNTAAPTVTGTAVEGQTLTATTGSWNAAAMAYGYQWYRCNGGGCSAISGATGTTYNPGAGDVGYSIEFQVTASDYSGSTTATSNEVGPVTAAPTPAAAAPTTTSTPAPTAASAPTATQITSALATVLTPTGKDAKIPQLLKSDGYSFTFHAPGTGTLTLTWTTTVKHKKITIATGKASFSATQTSKVKIQLTSAGKRLLKTSHHLAVTSTAAYSPGGQKITKHFTLA
jgi:hypothetical protein